MSNLLIISIIRFKFLYVARQKSVLSAKKLNDKE